MKTAKFSEIVKRCGEPSIYLTWLDPARDKTLKRAVAEHRLMTLHQELHGGKKDYGTVGFLKDRRAQLLVFPKSLRRFTDRKVIAVDYSLIAKDPPDTGVTSSAVAKKERRPVRAQPAIPPRHTSAEKIERPETKVIPRQKSLKPETNSTKKIAPPSPEKILAEVKRAVTELAAGKSVPAYERLRDLLKSSRT